MLLEGISTPKLSSAERSWYQYYAGYSARFVRDVLARIPSPPDALLLDPWCGSGTTVAVAGSRGMRAVGLDVNPALVVVSRARLLHQSVASSIAAICLDVHEHASQTPARRWRDDPLREWFNEASAGNIRALERSAHRLLVDPTHSESQRVDVAQISSLAALAYTAIFATTRSLLAPYQTSNPTWMRRRRPGDELIRVRPNELRMRFFEMVSTLIDRVAAGELAGDDKGSIELANSSTIHLSDGSVDVILGSPPYATRIDYVAGSRPELAVLGLDWNEMESLRTTLIGTPLTGAPVRPDLEWGDKATRFLAAVHDHPSKASATYYYAYFSKYFDDLHRSIRELARVAKPGAYGALVVQGSYYKEILCDLAGITSEMLASTGWVHEDRIDFVRKNSKASIHPGARKYRQTFSVVESLIVAKRRV